MRTANRNTKLFPLVKYFSRTSLVLISIVAMLLFFTYRQQTIQTLISHGEQANVVLTQAVSNTIWPEFRKFAPVASKLNKDELSVHPKLLATNQLVLSYIDKTPILKVKIFDLNGKTIYSTDFSQLAVQKPADYGGSVAAKTALVISELSHREKFSAVSGELFNRDVVSSYLPIRDFDVGGMGVAGVIEVYFDVTDQFAEVKNRQTFAFFFIVILLLLLYTSLYLIVKRADRIIQTQAISLRQSLKKIEEKNIQLDQQKAYFESAGDSSGLDSSGFNSGL
ncbi:MAG: hypothetical protein OEZ43_18950 [Gammaproteobacteria bacterium]|nr:hypothetical protein [Gammaproteobacteria bacterium]